MDLHVLALLPSPAERAAVDAVVPPLDDGAGPHAARGGHAARERRHLLLPALHAVQSRVGWISQPALGYVCRRLSVPPAEAYGVASFYALFSLSPRPPVVAHVCDDIACLARGAGGLVAELERALGPAGEAGADGRRPGCAAPASASANGRPRRSSRLPGRSPPRGVAVPPRRRAAPSLGDRPAAVAAGGTRPRGRKLPWGQRVGTDPGVEATTERPAYRPPSPNLRSTRSAPRGRRRGRRRPAIRACACWRGSASVDPASLDDYRAARRLPALARGLRARARGA